LIGTLGAFSDKAEDLKAALRLIATFTKPRQVVLDPSVGPVQPPPPATWITGIELDPVHHRAAADRLGSPQSE
jgi:hypothetical protein